jgi:hypothetical protein
MPCSNRDPTLVLGEWDVTGRGGGARLPTLLSESSFIILESGNVDRRVSISRVSTEDGVIGCCKDSGAIVLSGTKLLGEGAGAAIEPLLFDE